jgi:uncharacterized membrane protein YdjX (TVP38/TMEM64 family)
MMATAKKALLQIGPARIIKGLVTVLAILAMGYFAKSLDFEGWAKWIHFNESENALWYQGKSGYLLLGLAFTAIGGPRQLVAFFAAYFFGLVAGFFLALSAVTLSSLIAASLSRVFMAQVRPLVSGKIDVAFDFWRSKPFWATMLLRLMPVGSNLVTNLAAGATGVPLVAFVLGSMFGYMPQTAIFSLMGSGVDVGADWRVGLGIGFFILMTIVSLWIYGRYRRELRKRTS